MDDQREMRSRLEKLNEAYNPADWVSTAVQVKVSSLLRGDSQFGRVQEGQKASRLESGHAIEIATVSSIGC